VKWHYIAPEKSTQYVLVESFSGWFHDECLKETLFSTFVEARIEINKWRNSYNNDRPHSALGNLPSADFATKQVQDDMRPEINPQDSPQSWREIGSQVSGNRTQSPILSHKNRESYAGAL